MYWRDGVINYRRFFSINGLAGLRQEDPVVFEHSHRILNQLIAANIIDGVRVDHPDGLADPFNYLKQLRKLIGEDRWLLVEKILGVTEPLDPRLTVDGTTGYDALRELDGVFVHRPAVGTMGELALDMTGSKWDAEAFDNAEYELKSEVAGQELAAEVRRLARAIRSDNWSTSGEAVSDEELRDTLIELIAAMPVYRADYESLSRVTSTVIAQMIIRYPERADALDLIATALISRGEANVRFAQVCGAVMAKGVEDTAFYRGSRLVSLQEVGGAPDRFGVSPAEFHLLQAERARLWPKAMTTLTTHDTKRGEDVRSRISCITESAERFAELCDGIEYTDGGTCHFLLQNMIGVWPVDGNVSDELRERLHAYAEKAMREAGVHTTWFDVNEEFETSIHQWIDSTIDNHGRTSPPLLRRSHLRRRWSRYPRSCCTSWGQVSRTSTRARSSSRIRWSTRTIAARWTSPSAWRPWIASPAAMCATRTMSASTSSPPPCRSATSSSWTMPATFPSWPPAPWSATCWAPCAAMT